MYQLVSVLTAWAPRYEMAKYYIHDSRSGSKVRNRYTPPDGGSNSNSEQQWHRLEAHLSRCDGMDGALKMVVWCHQAGYVVVCWLLACGDPCSRTV
jgi:hypothetical protein